MKNQNLCIAAKSIIAVFVGIIIYFTVDTVVGLLAGIFLNNFIRLKDDTIFFQIVLKYIVAASNVRLITLVVNRIAPRNNKGHNISEYVIGVAIIISVLALTVMVWKNKNLDISGVIFCVFNLILGVVLLLDANKEFM